MKQNVKGAKCLETIWKDLLFPKKKGAHDEKLLIPPNIELTKNEI